MDVEGESKSMIDATTKKSFEGWSVKDILFDIQDILNKFERKKIWHIFREGNKVTKYWPMLGLLEALQGVGEIWRLFFLLCKDWSLILCPQYYSTLGYE